MDQFSYRQMLWQDGNFSVLNRMIKHGNRNVLVQQEILQKL